MLACDLVVASRLPASGCPRCESEWYPTCAGLFRGPRALPVNVARELILTGRPLDAARAYDVGMVNMITEPGAALESALALARDICDNSPVAVQACVAAVNAILAESDPIGWHETERALGTVAASDDAREGVAAFLERRPPRWTGR